MSSQAQLLLTKQLNELTKNPVEGFSAGLVDDDIFKWEIIIIGPPDTYYEGGIFKAIMTFPKDYPQNPPELHFVSEMWHPNINKDNGHVCISILHPPGKDEYGYECESERWLPVHTVESILISVISMLSSPNDESPENVDAAKQWREDREGFKKRVFRTVRKSQEEI